MRTPARQGLDRTEPRAGCGNFRRDGCPVFPPADDDAVSVLVEALLPVTRAMVAVAARSLAAVDPDITLPQFRMLMLLAARGPQRAVDIAAELRVNPSTVTRMLDRLVGRGLLRRTRAGGDRRVVRATLTRDGRELVAEVGRGRREELSRIVAGLAPTAYAGLVDALQALVAVAEQHAGLAGGPGE
jgi:DNA-binding MarR family transcriptional regulator